MKFISFIRSYRKSIIFTACILFLSFAPPSDFNGVPTFPNEDKLVHIFLYTCLTILLIFGFKNYKGSTDNKLSFVLYCLLFPVILGGLVEILQPMYFAPRTAEWLDWFSDITGVLIGWSATKLLQKLNVRI